MVKRELKFGNLVAKPGEIKTGLLRGVDLDFPKIDFPVIIANGSFDGPVLSITAAIHGTEITGVEIIRRVLTEEIDVKKLHGAIIAVPATNPLAFSWHEHATPQDRTNMAMVYPGDPNGTITRRMAHIVWTEIVSKTEYNIDLHHCGWPGLSYVWCKSELAKDPKTADKAMGMAKAVGLTLMHQGPVPFWGPGNYGSLTDQTMMKGIPSVTIELDVPMGRIVNEIAESGVLGTLNAMRYLGMTDGEIKKQPKNIRVVPGEFTMRMDKIPESTKPGVRIFKKQPGEPIKKGEVIAIVYDIYGEKMEEVKALIDCYMWAQGPTLVSDKSRVGSIFGVWDPQKMQGKDTF